MGLLWDGAVIAKKIAEKTGIIETFKPPKNLPEKLHPIFQDFTFAYSSKDVERMKGRIANSYTGTLYGAKTKGSLIKLFNETFKTFPRGVRPRLVLKVYEILKDTKKECEVLLEFKSVIKVASIPTRTFDTGKIVCIAKPELKHGIWQIISMETLS